jgi:hypothetical protein
MLVDTSSDPFRFNACQRNFHNVSKMAEIAMILYSVVKTEFICCTLYTNILYITPYLSSPMFFGIMHF